MEQKEKTVLRELASRVAEIAALPEQAALQERWYRHNALEHGRPMVLCFPEGSWTELLPQDELQCTDALARGWEWGLRATIYTYEHFHDDQVVLAAFNVPYVHSFSEWGVSEQIVGGQDGGAYRWIPPLQKLQDRDKLRFRTLTLDHEATRRRVELAQETFSDILKVRQKGGFWWSLGMTWPLIRLRGAQQILLDMYDNPEWLHSVMAFLRDGTLHELDVLEREGVLSLNNENDYVGSGGLGYSRELPKPGFTGTVRTCDMWGFGESQELAAVGPAQFDEFALQYQLPILSRFGLNCYGCCEPLDQKYGVIKKVHNLRRVSVSPFADLDVAVEALQDKYVFSWKPHPADIAARTFDPEVVRARVREALRAAEGCILEIILKDTHTCNNEPERFDQWNRVVRETVDEVRG